MASWHNFLKSRVRFGFVLTLILSVFHSTAAAENEGLADLDEAMRVKVNATGVRDVSKAIELLERALDRGLDAENTDFAESMISAALMERATALMRVINTRSIYEAKIQQIRNIVVSDLRRVLAYDSAPAQASLFLGRLMALPGGDPHEARRALTTYLQTPELTDNLRAEALNFRARLQADETKALADFDEAIRLAPLNPGYRLVRARYLQGHKKYDQALAELKQILGQAPDDANALILQGEVFRELGKMDEAIESFDKATVQAPKAPSPFQNRGEIYREQEEYAQAIAEFDKVLELQPGVLLTLVHRAEAYLYSGQLEEALSDVEMVLEKQQSIAAHRIRAEVLTKMDRLEEAIEGMERVSLAMPEQPELKMQLALYYLVDSQPRKAIEAYGDVIEIKKEHFLAWRSRGDAYLNIGQHAEAVADFEEALKLEPSDISVLNNLAWVLATSPDDKVRDASRSIELATQACEQSGYSKSHILSTLAAAYAESGDFETAIKWSQKAVDMEDPEHAEQLSHELTSYQENRPWRERQNVEDAKKNKAAPEKKEAEAPKAVDAAG